MGLIKNDKYKVMINNKCTGCPMVLESPEQSWKTVLENCPGKVLEKSGSFFSLSNNFLLLVSLFCVLFVCNEFDLEWSKLFYHLYLLLK